MPRRPPRHDASATRERAREDRAVSEVVSFILTFSILTMMIGVLYTAGVVSMAQLQTGNQMQNAEGVFFAMSDSFSELQEGQAPKRAGALDLDVGASISVSNESSVDVVVNGPGYATSLRTRSLDYRLEDRAVTYETGAVFRSNDDQTALLREPGGIFCTTSADGGSDESNASVVSVVTLVAPDGASQAAGTVTVTGVQRSTTILFPTTRSPTTAVENVTIDVSSPREAAWERYLTDAPGWEDPDGDGTFVCPNVDRAYVRHTVIEVSVSG